MRKTFILILLFSLLLGCTNKTNYEWDIKESEYKYEELSIEEEKQNVVLIEKTHNTESNEKKLSFRIYCHHYDIAAIIIAIKFSNNEGEFKKSFYETISKIFNIEMNSYIENSIQDLCVDLNKNYEIMNELTEIYDTDFSKCLIISLGNGEIKYENWDGKTYSIRNGKENAINYESKIYFGINNAYVEK